MEIKFYKTNTAPLSCHSSNIWPEIEPILRKPETNLKRIAFQTEAMANKSLSLLIKDRKLIRYICGGTFMALGDKRFSQRYPIQGSFNSEISHNVSPSEI